MSTRAVPSWSADPDAVAVRATARAFFAEHAAPHRQRWADQRHVDREFWRQAGRLGLLCMGVREELGGGGGSIAHDLVMLEEQARIGEIGFGNIVHSGIVAHYLQSYGTEEQQRTWLPPMATGEVVASIAMSEPGGGSDLARMTTRARADGDDLLLTGAKTFITNGGSADLVLVAATTDPAAGARGVSLLLVDTRDRPGFTVGRVLQKLGQHSGDTAELFFDEVRVPASALLGGTPGRGFAQLMTQLPLARLELAVVGATVAEVAVDLAVAHAKTRTAFGGPLFDKQHVAFELAECATLARVARTFVDSCVQQLLVGELDTATASMAKYWVTDTQCQVVDRCLQLFGGYGYMAEHPIAQMYADSRAQRIYGGTNEIMKELIARSL